MSVNKKVVMDRIYGMDLIRVLSFIAIIFHHFTSRLWYSQEFSPFNGKGLGMGEGVWYWQWAEVYSRSVSFSGYTILFLTSFLIAFTAQGSEKARRLISYMLIAWILWSITEYGETPFLLPWDIFPLIAFGLSIVVLISKFLKKPNLWLLLAGIILLFVPFWRFDSLNQLPIYLKHILIGDCELDVADWPILPWVGLILCGYSLGRLAKLHRVSLQEVRKVEVIFWLLLLSWTPFFWGSFYKIKFGDLYGCEVSRQEPIVFMAHWLWILMLMRMSLISGVQNKLSQSLSVHWISGLQINKNFGVAYFIHLFLIEFVVAVFKWELIKDPLASFLSVGIILFSVEVLLRILFRLWSRFLQSHTAAH